MRFARVIGYLAGWLLLTGIAEAGAAQPSHTSAIAPGEAWQDDRGIAIQAHGGGILRWHGAYYWFGEDRGPSNDPAKRFVSCYRSKDLLHWQFLRQAFVADKPEGLAAGTVVERPKVFYNRATKKFVMYLHLDDAHYRLARVGVAVSEKVDGPYAYVKSFRPLGQESRDIGQFVDDDGSAYLIFESRPTHGFFIAKLSADYLDVDRQVAFVAAPLEGGALVHYRGLYYVVGSHMTGWRPNPNVYATATTLAGPWTAMQDIAPPQTNTYDSQSNMLLKVVGTKATTVIYMGDRWFPKSLWDSRYIWMPLEIGEGKMQLPKPAPWTIDVKTGLTKILDVDAATRK